jgi:hypothetical protein
MGQRAPAWPAGIESAILTGRAGPAGQPSHSSTAGMLAPRWLASAVTAVYVTSQEARAQARNRHRHRPRLQPRLRRTATVDGAGQPVVFTHPPWVPTPVAQAALVLRADHLKHHVKCDSCEYILVLESLLTNWRMKVVWKELSKRRRENYRSTKAFKYQSQLSWIGPDDADSSQNNAMRSLLYFVLNHAVNGARVMTRAEVLMLHSRLLNEAETLRTAATLIRRRNPNQAAAAQVNDDTARACEADAALLAADESNRLVVERRRGDGQARCFAILLAGRFRQLFGSPMYGLTATVVSVALRRQITNRAVREWCSTPSG